MSLFYESNFSNASLLLLSRGPANGMNFYLVEEFPEFRPFY